jgi:hypothetical protein
MPPTPENSWRLAHKAVLEENDPDKLRQRIFALENALFLRAQQLLNTSNHDQEQADMLQASDDLLRLKTKLGWPKPSETKISYRQTLNGPKG